MTNNQVGLTITAEDRTKAAFASVNANMAKFGTVSAGASNAIRNASYQVSDFIVQVQGGQGAMRALSQQLPQLLAGFGAFGAVLGIVVGVLPTVVTAMSGAGESGKKLGDVVGDLGSAIGEVGRVAKSFDLDPLYKQFNSASEAARGATIEQIKFQQAMIQTQQKLAEQALGKSLGDLGGYGTGDKLLGAWGNTPAQNLAKQLGIALEDAKDMLPAIKGLRDGTEDASLFMRRFGVTLAESRNGAAQQLVKDIKSVADNSRDAYAAQSKLSEALQKMGAAGATGKIAVPQKGGARAKGMGFDYDDDLAPKGWVETLDELAAKYTKLADPLQKYRDQLDEINLLKINGKLTDDEVFAAQQRVLKGMEDERAKMNSIKATGADMFADLTRAVEGWGNAFTDAFTDVVMTGKLSFGSLAESVIRDLIRMQVQASITKPLFGFLGGALDQVLSGGSLFGPTGVFASKGAVPYTGGLDAVNGSDLGWTASANGNVFTSADLARYTNTIVNSPTLFKFAQGGAFRTGLMGEAGPEAILPLTRINGKLGVQAQGGAGDINNITIHIDRSGNADTQADNSRATELGRQVETAVRAVLIKEKRPGGLMAS